MFTGIITDIGVVRALDIATDATLTMATRYDVATIAIGASIAHDGICLTVVDKGADAQGAWYKVVASAHTQAVTTLGAWQVGKKVNLERALCMGDELGGHIVTGHVDGIAEIISVQPEGESVRFRMRAPQHLAGFIAEKGSVTLDGTSLTVTDVEGREFGLALIPHTLQVTTWGDKCSGDVVNLEIDVLARYVARMQDHGTGGAVSVI
jgi:riboflavin synthase